MARPPATQAQRPRRSRCGALLVVVASWLLASEAFIRPLGAARSQSAPRESNRARPFGAALRATPPNVGEQRDWNDGAEPISDAVAETAMLRQVMQELILEVRLLREALDDQPPAESRVEVHAERITPTAGPPQGARPQGATQQRSLMPDLVAEAPAPMGGRPLPPMADAKPAATSYAVAPVIADEPVGATLGNFPAIEQELTGKVFAWCHDGDDKTGEISFEAGGRTGSQAPVWNLPRWRVVAPDVVILDDHDGGNEHRLKMNIALTGFYCDVAGQRGYLEGSGFSSPDMADAPKGPGGESVKAEGGIASDVGPKERQRRRPVPPPRDDFAAAIRPSPTEQAQPQRPRPPPPPERQPAADQLPLPRPPPPPQARPPPPALVEQGRDVQRVPPPPPPPPARPVAPLPRPPPPRSPNQLEDVGQSNSLLGRPPSEESRQTSAEQPEGLTYTQVLEERKEGQTGEDSEAQMLRDLQERIRGKRLGLSSD